MDKQHSIKLLQKILTLEDKEKEETLLMKGKTVISIAHRISSIENADEIFVINQGTLASYGNHNHLLRKLYQSFLFS